MQEVQKEVQKLEQDFFRENNTWITTLDQNGNLKHADDFYFEITIDRTRKKSFGQQIIHDSLSSNLVNIERLIINYQDSFKDKKFIFRWSEKRR